MAMRAKIAMHRHLHAMSEKDVDALVQSVADLIVSYISENRKSPRRVGPTPVVKVAHEKETRE